MEPEREANGLDASEHFLVWSWRRTVTGGRGCPLVEREFSARCGEDADEVLVTFDTFLSALAYASRRRLQIGHPGSSEITGDERQILALVAAAQANARALLDAHLRWLARAELRPALAIATRALGTALGAHGLVLVVPENAVPNPGRPGSRFGGLPVRTMRGHAAP